MIVDILGWMNRKMKIKGGNSIKLFSFVYSISNKIALYKKKYCNN